MTYHNTGLSLALILMSTATWADTTDDDDDWDIPDDAMIISNYDAAADVNEGELAFLSVAPKKVPHQHLNHYLISQQSLEDGWVSLQQCHRHLDAVPRAAIVFSHVESRNMRLVSQKNINQAWVDGQSLELLGVQKNAELCLSVELRNLYKADNGAYKLKTGPYMRKFLDGYYPMHLVMDISYPKNLVLDKVNHVQQAGFDIKQQAHTVHLDALFEGRLNLEIDLLKQ